MFVFHSCAWESSIREWLNTLRRFSVHLSRRRDESRCCGSNCSPAIAEISFSLTAVLWANFKLTHNEKIIKKRRKFSIHSWNRLGRRWQKIDKFLYAFEQMYFPGNEGIFFSRFSKKVCEIEKFCISSKYGKGRREIKVFDRLV